jgi:hypothetical protein
MIARPLREGYNRVRDMKVMGQSQPPDFSRLTERTATLGGRAGGCVKPAPIVIPSEARDPLFPAGPEADPSLRSG